MRCPPRLGARQSRGVSGGGGGAGGSASQQRAKGGRPGNLLHTQCANSGAGDPALSHRECKVKRGHTRPALPRNDIECIKVVGKTNALAKHWVSQLERRVGIRVSKAHAVGKHLFRDRDDAALHHGQTLVQEEIELLAERLVGIPVGERRFLPFRRT